MRESEGLRKRNLVVVVVGRRERRKEREEERMKEMRGNGKISAHSDREWGLGSCTANGMRRSR